MRNLVRSLMLVGLLVAASAVESSAQPLCIHTGGAKINYFAGTYSPYYFYPCYGKYSTGSDRYKVAFGATMKWSQAAKDSIGRYNREEILPVRYTHDITDVNNHLGYFNFYGTTLPQPYFDAEDDDGDGYEEETEITVEDPNFPKVDFAYYIHVRFAYKPYNYGNNSGFVYQTPQLSKQYNPPFDPLLDKWNTWKQDTIFFPKSYPTYDAFSRAWQDNTIKRRFKEELSERVKLSQPLSIEDFTAQINSTGRTLKSFALEYEIETENGPDILTIGGVPSETELISSEGLQEMLNSLPESFKIIRFRGVVSYQITAFRGVISDELAPIN